MAEPACHRRCIWLHEQLWKKRNRLSGILQRPELAATDKIYEGIPEYLKNFSIDERDMTKYVIGAMSSVDTPLSPAVKGSRNLTAYLSGITDEMVQKKRNQILDVLRINEYEERRQREKNRSWRKF